MSESKDTTFVLRLQNENRKESKLENTHKHWEKSVMYGDKEIGDIESSNEHSVHEPTSIPSPFARIALAKTAFAEVAKHGDKALAAYQKIVSDSLDVAEIFFNFNNWDKQIQIIEWNRQNSLQKLKLSKHVILHKTLDTFLRDDAKTYNFDDPMKGIYILKHKKTGEVIGATSPCTLFFSSANKISVDIQLSSHFAFKDISPLHKRDWSFQEYLYTWVKVFNKIRDDQSEGNSPKTYFSEFAEYLEKQTFLPSDKSDKSYRPNKIEEINKLPTAQEDMASLYDVMRNPDVEILGFPLHKSKTPPPPPNEFLHKEIIRFPYKIQNESFFDGNLSENSKYSYLIPVTDKFFEHYSVEYLQKNIRINESGTAVEVKLRFSEKEEKRVYLESNSIINVDGFDCAIFPNVKFKSDTNAHYRFGLVCGFKEKDNFDVKFIKIKEDITAKQRVSFRNETQSTYEQLKNYLLTKSNFDYIKLSYKERYCGVILPKMKQENGSNEFTFAVDFGTTNTHIEYKINKDAEQTFDIIKQSNKNERQVHWLHAGEDILRNVFDEEYIPAYTDEEFRFPMRSKLSYGENTPWNNVYPFEKAGLAVLYEKRLGFEYNTILSEELKWSNHVNNQKQVECYICSIMYLLRNKVLLNNGNLEKTKIRWFYPVSMETGRQEHLKKTWEESYAKYFLGITAQEITEEIQEKVINVNVISMSESVAPFEYYVKDGDSNNLVTIDIGGGTTDIVFAKSRDIKFITSFRFAANTIFGDGFSETGRVKNGMVRQFMNIIRSELKTVINENDTIFKIFDDMEKNKSSADAASFLFSLKDNKKIKQAGENIANTANLSFKLVNDPTQKITFIFFYAAIIYHLAKIMKSKEFDMPDKIVFSGNGSRVIPFFTDNMNTLKGFTKLIFRKIYQEEQYNVNDLDIILNKKNPKEATCKGGLYVTIDDLKKYSDIMKKQVVLHSKDNKTIIQVVKDDIEKPQESDTYKAVDDNYLKATVEETKKFIQFVFDLLPFFTNQGYELNNDSIDIAKEVCFQKLDTYAKNGWELKDKEVKTNKNDVIKETLFFYPLIGMLKALCDKICDNNKLNANNNR